MTVGLTKPSLDPRYALGNCDHCTPARKAHAKGMEVTHRGTAILRELR